MSYLRLRNACEMVNPNFHALNGWDCMDWPQVTWDSMWIGPKITCLKVWPREKEYFIVATFNMWSSTLKSTTCISLNNIHDKPSIITVDHSISSVQLPEICGFHVGFKWISTNVQMTLGVIWGEIVFVVVEAENLLW